MIPRGSFATLVAFAGLLSACAAGTPGAVLPVAVESADVPTTKGYLTAAVVQRLADSIPTAPATGSQIDLADKAGSQRFTSLEDTDRWLLATSHAEVRPPFAIQHFDCTLGFSLSTAELPQLSQLMTKMLHDADGVAEHVKARGFRARPVEDDPSRKACQRINDAGRATPSYPSGTAAVAAAYGELFAGLAPEKAADVRSLAHAMALSRLVCGMHYPQDVAVGETLGKSVFNAAAATPQFRLDLDAARREVASAQARATSSPNCAAEQAALAIPLP